MKLPANIPQESDNDIFTSYEINLILKLVKTNNAIIPRVRRS